ncbi:DEAD/DEAH box helicase domain-containing protein [Mumia flava]|uniref:DEAD/DEAH box helicase domain-containing protein n=1 Tax=Mumia flava TaxID=1348852 RepID=A0A0B2BEL1_9ACTN|nr:DEAD/DEAH box helicase [Mumia flava]PJJ57360.1 DEAD/DEAH box helicase domain-containing protein [Mumia flava]
MTDPVETLLRTPGASDGRLLHLQREDARQATYAAWPAWVDDDLRRRFAGLGADTLWAHQAEAAERARAGRHVVVATGTASGKSAAYLLPAVTALRSASDAGQRNANGLRRLPSVLYLAPTKALARDQLAALDALVGDDRRIRSAAVDGDNSREERQWARDHANWILTNPDLLHRTLLPSHARWARFLAGLQYVVVDETHHYRGVFGSHVAHVLRRLRRLAASYGADPTFVLASATAAEPARSASLLTGLEVSEVVDDAAPRGEVAYALWEPPLIDARGADGAPVRRSATTESAGLLADLVSAGIRTLAFVRSRRGAETVALAARAMLGEVHGDLADRVGTYRGGYLPEERRAIETDLREGRLLGLATTNALELGIDIAGLDAVLTTGFPGTRAALRQQFGRAGRRGGSALGVLVARDDPLDTYLVHHPEALLGAPVEATVLDPSNPHVIAGHLAAAAQETALTEGDLELFGPGARDGVEALVAAGWLRRRAQGWFWVRRDRAADLVDIRSVGGQATQIVDTETGRLLGTVDGGRADGEVHDGAVYVHRGESFVVEHYDPHDGVALVRADEPDHTTSARTVTDIAIVAEHEQTVWDRASACFGEVDVSTQVVSYVRRRSGSGEVLGEVPLDLPVRTLRTSAVWWTLPGDVVAATGLAPELVPGAAHAAEHAAIGLLPLLATCDRWDIGGVSTAMHPDTGMLTVFVHDALPGGAGFARRGYDVVHHWLQTTRQAIASCTCPDGCPSCVQSPKCGNGNHPLSKTGAIVLLDAVLAQASLGSVDAA